MSHPVNTRDHGGGIDAACLRYGGTRNDWVDLSTGINPNPYPVADLAPDAWTALPDQAAMDRLMRAARQFWNVPDGAMIVAASGASALIALMPFLTEQSSVYIPQPTYNEHEAAFGAQNRPRVDVARDAPVHVHVHPNNPDGRMITPEMVTAPALSIIDESFCDTCPQNSLVGLAARPDVVVLKSFGKFWGLAGMRLGFAIARPEIAHRLADMLGPWAVSGPALQIGAEALEDHDWADQTRLQLEAAAQRLDALMAGHARRLIGGTSLFRSYEVEDAAALQARLASAHIWTRIFPYSTTWIRFGLPASEDHWARLEEALS